MVEWSITPVLKTGVLRGTGGSNPSLSAKSNLKGLLFLFLIADADEEQADGYPDEFAQTGYETC